MIINHQWCPVDDHLCSQSNHADCILKGTLTKEIYITDSVGCGLYLILCSVV